MDNKLIKIAVILLFVFGMIFYVVSLIKMQSVLNNEMSYTFEIMGNCSMVASIIGATQIRKD